MGEKLTRRRIESWLRNASVGEWLWCGELRGFGVQRRGGEGEAAFVTQFRVGTGRLAKRRRTVIGTFPTMTPEAARVAAGDLINAGRKGDDPVAVRRAEQAAAARKRDTYTSLGDVFWSERRKALRASSANLYESVWRRFRYSPTTFSDSATTAARYGLAQFLLTMKARGSNRQHLPPNSGHQNSAAFTGSASHACGSPTRAKIAKVNSRPPHALRRSRRSRTRSMLPVCAPITLCASARCRHLGCAHSKADGR